MTGSEGERGAPEFRLSLELILSLASKVRHLHLWVGAGGMFS